MSDNCAIVCNAVDALACGCNSDGGRICSAYSSCTSNRRTRKTEATYSEFTPYCYIVNSYKYDITKNSNDVKCSTYDTDNTSEVFKCQGVRDIAKEKDNKTYIRKTGEGKVLNTILSSNSDERYNTAKPDSMGIENSVTDVKAIDLNVIIQSLKEEINQRKKHHWYNSTAIDYNQDNVTTENTISYIQQNTPGEILAKLRNIIYQKDDFDDINVLNAYSRKTNTGEMIKVQDLKNIEIDLFNINKDCICYSDCTNFLVRAKRSCSCNIDCVCNYR